MRWVYWERPALPGSRWEGERVQSRGNGSQPSQVERVLTYPTHYTYYTHYTHVRVLPAHTDRLHLPAKNLKNIFRIALTILFIMIC